MMDVKNEVGKYFYMNKKTVKNILPTLMRFSLVCQEKMREKVIKILYNLYDDRYKRICT